MKGEMLWTKGGNYKDKIHRTQIIAKICDDEEMAGIVLVSESVEEKPWEQKGFDCSEFQSCYCSEFERNKFDGDRVKKDEQQKA